MARISSFIELLRRLATRVRLFASTLWTRYRTLTRWLQVVIALFVIAALFGLFKLTSGGATPTDTAVLPTVTVARVDALTGTGSSVAVIGSVRSVTEAAILAQSGGTVTALHSTLGQYVSAGFIIAELENASQRALVLQAEGAYEAAVAARSGISPSTIATTARNTYATAYSTLDTLLTTSVDTLFGEPTAYGPTLLINAPMYTYGELSRERAALTELMREYQRSLSDTSASDPMALLTRASVVAQSISNFLDKLAVAATDRDSDATSAQLTALASARAGNASLQASITAAKSAFQGQNTSATTGADAAVKIALGSLRAAQAQLEKTLVRAPISGTVNFIPIRIGDYVSPFTHVATVAQNGTLEIIAYVSEMNRASLSIGAKVMVEDTYPAIITSIAPALDPVTKQVEIHLALTGKSSLVNGQSVRVALPSDAPATISSKGPLLLPLTALKLTPSARVVFSVGPDSRLVAHPVEIADVHGDRIQINTSLPSDLEIVTDARGFSEGQKVTVTTP